MIAPSSFFRPFLCFQALLVIVHARAKVGYHLESPALSRAVKLQNLLLALQISLLIVTGHAGIGDGFARRIAGCAVLLGAQF